MGAMLHLFRKEKERWRVRVRHMAKCIFQIERAPCNSHKRCGRCHRARSWVLPDGRQDTGAAVVYKCE